jgi:hypothetical protein
MEVWVEHSEIIAHLYWNWSNKEMDGEGYEPGFSHLYRELTDNQDRKFTMSYTDWGWRLSLWISD